MGYKVIDVPEITVNVDIAVPGQSEKSRISATWVLHDFEAYQKKNEIISSGQLTDEQLVEEDLISAGPFYDEKGKDIQYSLDLIKKQLQKTYFRQALIRSWWDAQMCRNEAAEKN